MGIMPLNRYAVNLPLYYVLSFEHESYIYVQAVVVI